MRSTALLGTIGDVTARRSISATISLMTTAVRRLAKRIRGPALVLITLVVITLAYQTRRPMEIDLGSASASAPFVENFHDAEGAFRWSRAASCVVLPDVGAGVAGRVELDVSAFRPRPQRLPIIVVEAESARERRELVRGVHTVALDVTPDGWWSSDLRACVRSETFKPGAEDERQLGVRVHRARWVPVEPGPTTPPLRQLLFSILTVLFLWSVVSSFGAAERWAALSGVAAALTLGAAYTWMRGFAAALSLPVAIVCAVAFIANRFLPELTAAILRFVSFSARCWWRGARTALSWPAVATALCGTLAVTGAYLARPVLSFDLGSGHAGTLAERFGSLDSDSGTRFRKTFRGAALDLTDFGGGASWRITVAGSLAQGGDRSLPLARASGIEGAVSSGQSWTSTQIEVDAPVGWRSGVRLEFPTTGSRIERVDVDRGRSLPPLRIVFATVAAALAFTMLAGACGLTRKAAFITAGLVLVLEAAALYIDPVLSVPFASTFFGIASLATLVAALTAGALASSTTISSELETGPVVATVVSIGFVVWLAALSAPLYRGLHFIYHSNIAEEIWNGKFLVFYLPHPDNILSREAQWGGLLVPYSCLYHTLIAPLSALPSIWFQQTQKIFQASLLTWTAFAGALGASRLAGGRSAVWAATLLVTLPATFQLLGLAHFVTVFGLCAPTLAFVFLILNWGKLNQRSIWWGAVALVTVAFLSYTAALLFTGFTIAVALPLLARADRRQASSLLTASIAAVAASLLLYYMHWVLPFVRESIPLLLDSGEGEPLAVAAGIARIPRKLDYSFGSVLLPVTGLIGVGLVAWRSRDDARWILVAWASVLVCFSVADLFFNFILKHHYFTLVPVAIGTAAVIDQAMSHKWARWAAWAGLTYAVALGVRAALALAMGTIE